MNEIENQEIEKVKQEIFNQSYNHVIKAGQPSIRGGSKCQYSGIGCAASVFIEEKSKKEADNLTISRIHDICKKHPEMIKKWLHPYLKNNEIIDLLLRVQEAHDGPALLESKEEFVGSFRYSMRLIARKNNLEIPNAK